jgi:hypothetical protein
MKEKNVLTLPSHSRIAHEVAGINSEAIKAAPIGEKREAVGNLECRAKNVLQMTPFRVFFNRTRLLLDKEKRK